MATNYESLRKMFERISSIGTARNGLGIREVLILIEVVRNPQQSHKYYKDDIGVENAARMSRYVGRLTDLGLVESDWQVDSPTSKYLKATDEGQRLISELMEIVNK